MMSDVIFQTRDLGSGSDKKSSAKAQTSSKLDLLLAGFDENLGATRRLKKPRFYLYAIAVITILALVWMTFAKVDRVVRMSGRVIPSDKTQLVQHLEGGIISKVHVREGDIVQRGQALLAVADLPATSSQAEKQARFFGLLAKEARLEAEAQGAPRFTAPKELGETNPAVSSERDAFDARQTRLTQTVRVIQEQLAQKQQELAEASARRTGLSSELSVAKQQYALVSGMLGRNAASQFELLDARAKTERLSTQISETELSIPRLRAAVAELQARIGEIKAQFRSEAQSLLSDTRIDLQRIRQELKTDEDRVRRTEVRAPTDGTVNKMLANTVGGVVRPGDTLLEITPVGSSVAMEAKVSPAERGPLQIGQDVVIRVAAFDYTVHGTLHAKITEISADTLVDERGERYFRVAIEVSPESYLAFGRKITPGMTVSADAITGQRTIMQYILSPVRAIADNSLRDQK
jgi:adhesin transport system membrane fusion protein